MGNNSSHFGGVWTVQVDKNKSPEQYIKDVEAKFVVPPLIREDFPDFVKLLFEAESMDQEEREYWLQIMAVMTEDQVVKLRDILVKEKNQLEELDRKYEREINRLEKRIPPLDQETIKKRVQAIKAKESVSREEEESEAEDVLKQLEGL